MKLIVKIIFSIVLFGITNTAFAQEFSDKEIGLDVARITAKLKERGVQEQYIQQEISSMRDKHKQMYVDQKKGEEQFFRKIKAEQKVINTNRTSSEIPASERNALIELYNFTGGANWTNTLAGNHAWLVNDPNAIISGNWWGVGISNGHVVSINLNNNNLNGTLPPSIGNLPFITYFSLNNNILSGSIPSQIGMLSDLAWLDLSRNMLNGSLPIEFYNLTKLWNLVLHNNNLSGSISSQIGQMTSLKTFWVNGNSFSGVIPNEVGLLTNMVSFQLGYNQFSGNIPVNLYQMTSLTSLGLESNQLVGSISPQIGQLTNLSGLTLQANNLSGELPLGIGQLLNLIHLWLNNNQFTGTIPPSYGSLISLSNFSIHTNMLEGSIPSGFQYNTQFSVFQISDNNFSGPLPDLSNNLYLSRLMIHNNRFRFVDFINSFSVYKTRTNGAFGYSPQAKIDTPKIESRSVGQPINMTMCEDDNRFHLGDTFQWYKNGTLISGATNRIYTIPSVISGDAGVYTCKSYHTTSPDMSPLVLEREPITLNVTNGTPLNACPETFEGATFPPAGWAVLDNGVGTVESWKPQSPTYTLPANSGNIAAMINRENIGAGNTSQDWLVTSRFTVPANGELRFFTRQITQGDNGNIHEIRVSTNPTQNNQAAYNTIQTWTETTLNTTYNVYEDKRVNLSAYVGQEVYVAFVKVITQPTAATAGDRWLIDDVRVVEQCQAPSLLSVGNYPAGTVTPTTATLSWTNNGSATQWEVEIVPENNTPTGVGVLTNNNPYVATNLIPGSVYKFYVRAICSSCEANNSVWVGPFNFGTPLENYCPAPTNLIVTNYNGASANVTWTESGTATSWEVIATPVSNTMYPGSQPTVSGIVVTQNSYVITGLDPNIEYVFFVRAVCNTSNSSLWSSTTIKDTNNQSCTSSNSVSPNIGNPASNYVGGLFANLIDDIRNVIASGGTITSAYDSPQLQALKPFITDANPGIYNFTGDNSNFSFSFSNHNDGMADVLISSSTTAGLIQSFSLESYYSPVFFIYNISVTFEGGYGKMNIRHINFCPNITSCTKTNPLTVTVKQLYLNLINKLMTLPTVSVPNGFTCPELVALSPYITDANPAIYNFYNTANPNGNYFHFSFSNVGHYNGTNPVFKDVMSYYESLSTPVTDINLDTYFSSNMASRVLTTLSNGVTDDSKGHVKHINFCPTTISCTVNNPNSVEVNKLFTKLAQKLISMKLSGTTDANMNGITLPEFTYLEHYISDNNPGIYNFTSTYNTNNQLIGIKFSFLPNETAHDVLIEGWQSSFVSASNYLFNLSGYESSSAYLNITDNLYNNILVKNIQIRHVEFCPDELWCKKHIAIVVDESGSISESEARKIRKQLKNFIKEQANANFLTGSNTYVSLIGLSDTDIDSRGDHYIPINKILPSNLAPYTTWITNYRQRDNTFANPNSGASANSDYWNSGLKRALDEKADIVILITDGCQTANPTALKATMARFNNNRTSTTDPHLYVIGLENGFYVDQSTVSNKTANLTPENDPNLNPELSRVDATSREAGFLRKSLKYLLNYGNTPEPLFPLPLRETLLDGAHVVRTFLTADYFGHDDFRFLGSEENYIYNHLKETNITCGDSIPSQNCDDCFGYQPIPDKEYILSAWVKQDRNDQVIKYKIENPASGFIGVKLEFRKSNPDGTIDDNTTIGANPVYNIKCEPNANGEIIEGWQRIFKKFKVPSDAEFFNIILVNEDNGIPLYFDDIRIHPIDGSMKSFVYDPETYKLMSELDENNYSTFYEYDKEGGLIRVKKETAKGVKTIQETRSGNVLKE